MKNKVTSAELATLKDGQIIETPLFRGSTLETAIDNVLSIERQDVYIKQDFLFEGDFSGNHLEFTFPISGKVELEINQKYMHTKAETDLVSLSAFEHKTSSIYAKKGESVKLLAINLNPDIYYKSLDFTKKLTKGNTNLYKISGDDSYITKTVNQLYQQNPSDDLARAEQRFLVYQLIEYCVAKITSNLTYHRCIDKSDNEFKIKKAYKEVYGETLFETIRQKRMQYASQLIASNKYTLNEIAYLCGYQNYPSFYKSFKKYFSFAPSEI